MIERIFKHHPIALVFALFGVILIILATFVQNELDNRDAQDARYREVVATVAAEQVERRVDDCESSNNSRAALQAVLDQVADPPPEGAAAVDFSEVKGWEVLDPTVQFYLANLSLALRDVDPNFLFEVAEDYRKSNPVRDCALLEKELRAELRPAD